MKARITAKTVAAFTLADGKTEDALWDDEQVGFGLRLRRSGGKVLRRYLVQWKRGGTSKRILLGSDAVLSAEQARTAAKKLLAKVQLGEDPAAEKKERRDKDALTMQKQVTEFLAIKETKQAPRTFVESKRYLTDPKYFGPLHSMPLDTIALRHVAARIDVIERECGSPTAARARGALVTFFAWAMRRGLCTSNPTIGSDNPKTTARDRVLTPAELVAIWKACGDDHYGKIIRLLILLGARRQEIGGLAWSECDLEAPQPSWTLPKARSKNKRAHTLPLLPMALAIVRSVPKLVSRDRLFGESATYGFSSWPKGKRARDQRCGVTNFTVHDLRRSTATGMADIGIAPHIIEAVLNHYSGHRAGVAGVYNRSPYEREVKAALIRWSEHVRDLVEGRDRRKVVSLHA